MSREKKNTSPKNLSKNQFTYTIWLGGKRKKKEKKTQKNQENTPYRWSFVTRVAFQMESTKNEQKKN